MPKIPSQLQQIKDLIAREVARQKAAPAVTQYASGAGVPSLPVTPTPTVVSSDDVPEGQTNLYFTDARVYAAVKAALLEGDNITITPDDEHLTLTIASTGGGASTFLDLTDTPAAYTDMAGKVVAVNVGETALEFTDAGAGDMTEAEYATNGTPGVVDEAVTASTAGSADTAGDADTVDGQHAAAFEPALGNPAADGYLLSSTDEGVRSWIAPPSPGAEDFVDLGDVPASYEFHGGKIVGVKEDESGLEFVNQVTPGATAFTGLTDAPASYDEQAGKLVAVNGTEDGLEFVTALTGGGSSPRNLLCNGGFDIAQRMVTPATGFIPGDGNYAFDRWYVLTNNGAHITASQGSGPTSTARYSGLLTNDAATGKFGMAQIVEGGECIPLREQTLQAQIQLLCSENGATLVLALLEWGGTIDEPTADVVSDWNNGTLEAEEFFIAGVTVLGVDTQESTADTWHALSCTGTPSTSCRNLYLFWAVIDDVDTGYVAATAADLFVGSETRAWAPVSLAEDLARCQRYCFVPKADNSFRRIGQRYGTKYINMIRYECPVTMRATPGVTSNISGWQASTTPTTTNVAFYNNEADGLATITGALTVLPQLISADGFYFGFSAGTSFSGTAGQWGTFIPGPEVRIVAEAELGE